MKTLQKATLAAAIAAAPFFATNALEALDDDFLSNMTGQAGVTIETTTDASGITIGSIEYTDTKGGAGDVGGGSLVIQNDGTLGAGIKVTGVQKVNGEWVDGIVTETQTIDIDESGNLITNTTTSGYKRIQVGEVRLRSEAQSQASSSGARLASGVDIIQSSNSSKAHILNISEAGNTYNDIMNIGDVRSKIATHTKGGGDDVQLAIVTESESSIINLNADALDGAIGIRGLRYGANADGTGDMHSTQVIWAKAGAAADGGGIYIAGSASSGTLVIGEVHVGQSNIGTIKISDINQAGSVQRIYGH